MNSISAKNSADNPGLLTLTFHGTRPELYRSEFRRPLSDQLISVRGKTAAGVSGAGSFQWTSAVKALTLILCKVAAQKFDHQMTAPVSISGQEGSLASSLDYALSKQPMWLIEMFGVDSCSNSYLRRILYRSNPERKLPGPVIISVNPKVMTHNNIECWWNGKLLDTKSDLMNLITLLENDYESNRAVMARAA